MRFRKLENLTRIAPSTWIARIHAVKSICLSSGSLFIDVHDMILVVGTVEIGGPSHNQAEIKRRRDEGSTAEGLSWRRVRDPPRHCARGVGEAVELSLQDVVL